MDAKKSIKDLIEEAFDEAMAKIRKIKRELDLKNSQALSFKEKEEINSILDKIKNEF